MRIYRVFAHLTNSISAAVLATSLSQSAQASSKYGLVLSAGGEPKRFDATTMFDNEVALLGRVLGEAGYKSTVFYDGGQIFGEKRIQQAFNTNISQFDSWPATTAIKDFIRKIENGIISKGDSILVFVNSHGAPANDDKKLAHEIAANNGVNIDLAELKELAKVAQIYRVKLAIWDDSCYSGNSLELATSEVCVISSAAKDQVGYTGLVQSTKLFEPGRSLEEIYLDGRRNFFEPAQPQISGAAGKAAGQVVSILKQKMRSLYDVQADFLESSGAVDKKNQISKTEGCMSCQNPPEPVSVFVSRNTQDLARLMPKLSLCEKVLSSDFVLPKGVSSVLKYFLKDCDDLQLYLDLLTASQDYFRSRRKAIEVVAYVNGPYGETVESPPSSAKLQFSLTMRDLAVANIDSEIKAAEKNKALVQQMFDITLQRKPETAKLPTSITNNPSFKYKRQADEIAREMARIQKENDVQQQNKMLEAANNRLEGWKWAKQRKAELDSEPEFKRYTDAIDSLREFLPLSEELKVKASKVAAIERKIYDKAYAEAARQSKAPNPCRDFKL